MSFWMKMTKTIFECSCGNREVRNPLTSLKGFQWKLNDLYECMKCGNAIQPREEHPEEWDVRTMEGRSLILEGLRRLNRPDARELLQRIREGIKDEEGKG